MMQNTLIARDTAQEALDWAVNRRVQLKATMLIDDAWAAFNSTFLGQDVANGLIEIASPMEECPPEIVPDQTVGISFRRGHKKCLFTSVVVGRKPGRDENSCEIETVILRRPEQIREVQRRAYQRAMVPADRFVAVKLWEGGAPVPGQPSWPIGSGRVNNISVGGIMVDIRNDQNPRLSIGDVVGVEVTVAPGKAPLIAEAQYRHCASLGEGRMGLGFQFIGLEHDMPDCTPLNQLTQLVRDLHRSAPRG